MVGVHCNNLAASNIHWKFTFPTILLFIGNYLENFTIEQFLLSTPLPSDWRICSGNSLFRPWAQGLLSSLNTWKEKRQKSNRMKYSNGSLAEVVSDALVRSPYQQTKRFDLEPQLWSSTYCSLSHLSGKARNALANHFSMIKFAFRPIILQIMHYLNLNLTISVVHC